MKKFFLTAALLALALLCLAACPGDVPMGPPPEEGSNGLDFSTVFPQDGSKPASGVWSFYAVSADKTEKTDYTEIADFAEGKFTVGDAYLANGKAAASSATDVAFGCKAEKDGILSLSLDGLFMRAGNTPVKFSVYKNGTRIWPVSAEAYEVPDVNRADILKLDTAVKTGDVVFFRISGGALAVTPKVVYTADAYAEEKDLEKTRPDFSDARIEGVGATLEAGSIASTGRTPSATPIEMTTDDFIRAFSREELEAGTTYRLTDSTALTLNISRSNYDGLGCTVITGGDVSIVSGSNSSFANLSIITDGSVNFHECENVTFRGLEILAKNGIAADVDFTCSALRFEDCRFVGTNLLGMRDSAISSVVVNSYIAGKTAVETGGEYGSLFENCVISGEDTAVWASGDSVTVWYSTLRGSVRFSGDKTANGLVAMNRFENLGGVSLWDKTHNCVVLLNELESVEVSDSTNTYVCHNLIFDRLSLSGINYTLATRNEIVSGRVLLSNVKNHNGDNITDTAARPNAGANEELLPHVNKDAFINMERKSFVRTADGNSLPLAEYINEKAASNGMLIIAPGAYSGDTTVSMKNIEDFSVYAYGVLYEKDTFFNVVYNFGSCTRVAMYGLTMDMNLNGCGHMIVLSKDSASGTVTYRAAAGMLQDLSDTKYFSEDGNGISFMGYRAGKSYPYADIGLGKLVYNATNGLLTSTPSASSFEMIEPGDMMTCRANGNTVVYTNKCDSLLFEDFTVLSGSIRCFWEDKAIQGASLERVLISPAPAKVIDEDTYADYLALEEKHGVDLGIYVDEWGNYRGTPAMTVTADSTHTTDSRDGIKATSCIFENLSDDGTNQQGFHGRLASYDPATGTVTYKGNLSTIGAANGSTVGRTCDAFLVGDTVCIYTSTGRILCETPALSVTAAAATVDGQKHYTVKIDPSALDPAELENYDMTSNAAGVPRILIDNLNTNGGGFVYDNVVAQNIRSRGFLVKCAFNTIKNCTFRNIGMAAVGLIFEPEWGESGVANDTEILNCYFENTGYFSNRTLYSPITVMGLGLNAADEYLPYVNITVSGNVIRNRATDYALYLNSAKDVVVSNNDFGTKVGEDIENPFPSVCVNYANGVRFDGNTYSPYLDKIGDMIVLHGHRNITGSDFDTAVADDIAATPGAHISVFYENLPGVDANGNLKARGAWQVGYSLSGTISTFKEYKVLHSGWYTETANSLWSSSGGIDMQKDFRYAALRNANPIIRYNAEYSGKATVRLSTFSAPYATGSGSDDGYYAIFVNGEMVWPTAGGSYGVASDWYPITQKTTYTSIASDLSDLVLDLEEGDTVDFVAKRKDEWSAFAAVPFIVYLKEE